MNTTYVPFWCALLAVAFFMPACAEEIVENGWNVSAQSGAVHFETPMGYVGDQNSTTVHMEGIPSIMTKSSNGSLGYYENVGTIDIFKLNDTNVTFENSSNFTGGQLTTNPSGESGLYLKRGGLFLYEIYGISLKVETVEDNTFSMRMGDGREIDNLISLNIHQL